MTIHNLAIFLLGLGYGIIAWELLNRQFYRSFVTMTQSAIDLARIALSESPDEDDPEREDVPEDNGAKVVAFGRRAL